MSRQLINTEPVKPKAPLETTPSSFLKFRASITKTVLTTYNLHNSGKGVEVEMFELSYEVSTTSKKIQHSYESQ